MNITSQTVHKTIPSKVFVRSNVVYEQKTNTVVVIAFYRESDGVFSGTVINTDSNSHQFGSYHTNWDPDVFVQFNGELNIIVDPYQAGELQRPVESHTFEDSSVLNGATYIRAERTLTLEFKNSLNTYSYKDVPYGTYVELCEADSAGEYYSRYIKGQYKSEKVV